MKVSELKEALNEFPDDFEVILPSDSEGNSYNTLSVLEHGRFNQFGYEINFTSWKEYEIDENGDEVEVLNPRELTREESNAVALWP